MLAQESLDTLNYNDGFLSWALSDSQWMYEIVHWHNITSANMQRWAIDYG